ncbi:MAG TPA: caspase family protein [Bryobacteraceae bacterium]|nr:caspase family protein [Bryobacteraceae bacterium]
MFRAALLVCVAACTYAQTPQRDLRYDPGTPKVALLVGNEAYPKWPLRNPVNDARVMDQALRETGFQTEVILNATLRDLERAIDRFVGKLHAGDVALFYYAGHGIQINGENYLIPVDFDAKDEADAKYVSYSASRLQDRIETAGARLSLLVFDACRNNPFKASRAAGGGLAAMNTGKGTLIALATSPGKTADDNPGGNNGLFTSHLVTALREPGLSLDQVFNRVRERVYSDSNQRQLPWTVSSVIGEFYFKPGAQQPAAVLPAQPSPPPVENSILRAVRQSVAPDVSHLVTEASNAYTRGDYQGAIVKSQEALRADGQNKDALWSLTASYFRTQQYDLFEATAVQAIKAGAEIPFLLGHHHTLSGIHASTLKISASAVAFDPMGFTGCNQKAFTVPFNTVVSAKRTTNMNAEVFLNLRIQGPQKVVTFNFADSESTVDSTKGFPIVRSPARANRAMSAIANVVTKAQAP